MSYLRYLCLFSYSGVQQILCCAFVLIYYILYVKKTMYKCLVLCDHYHLYCIKLVLYYFLIKINLISRVASFR
jgi:hypothetical protein